MQSLPEAQISLLSRTAHSAFWVQRQDTPRCGECNDQASHTPAAGIPVCLPPLADMPEDRHPALRESVRPAGVAYSDPGIATPTQINGGRDERASHPPCTNESRTDEIEIVQSWPQRQDGPLHHSQEGHATQAHPCGGDDQEEVTAIVVPCDRASRGTTAHRR